MKARHTFIVIAVTVLFYAAVVFGIQALIFGGYQFLRDRGYGFWQSNAIFTLGYSLMAFPAIYHGIGRRFRK